MDEEGEYDAGAAADTLWNERKDAKAIEDFATSADN